METDRIIVRFKRGADREMVHKRCGGRPSHSLLRTREEVVYISGDLQKALERYASDPAVESVVPDYTVRVLSDDFCYPLQWGLEKIQVPQAWNITRGAPEIKIAILDTGIDLWHKDLVGKIVASVNFSSDTFNYDMYGHGTHVAGIVAAVTDNGLGVAGVACDCTLLNVKVLNSSGGGYYSDLASGIRWSADNGAKVINMSLGGTAGSSILEEAVNYAWGKGCVLVAAAGNSNTSSPYYPAYYANCIAVAATDPNDDKAYFSNFGSWVDVAAPGVGILATLPRYLHVLQTNYGYPRMYGALNGTSMATPFVAGIAGLLWATQYGTSNASVRDRITNTAEQVGGIWNTFGIKRINAYSACA